MATCSVQIINENTVLTILKKLQSNIPKEVYSGLREIRKNVIKTSTGLRYFHENGGLKSLVMFLDSPNERNLDISLSILANCCLDFDFRKEAGDLNISSSVVSILNNINTDSILCRACRLLGNLAQDNYVARQLHENGAVAALMTTIPVDGHETDTSEETRQMAIRALGALWSVPERRGEMLRMNVVNAVAFLMTKDTTPQLLETVLKAISIFTRTPSQKCAVQVNANGTGFQSLVSIVSNPSLEEFALTCICNLCSVASSRPLLGNAGAVDVLVSKIKENLHPQLLQALCLLSRDSGNRSKIRQAGGLQVLLEQSRNQRQCLKSLEHYIYDDPSITELLNIGLLPMLVELLAHCRRIGGSRKRKRRKFHADHVPGSSPECRSEMSPSRSPYMSPRSSTSSPNYAPSSPSSSVATSELEDEENYSPVCSSDEGGSDNIEKTSREMSPHGTDAGPILILLARISHIETPVVNMATSETLGALLDYLTINTDPHPRAGRILARICRNPLYFIHIVLAGFVPRVHAQLLSSEQSDLGTSLIAQLSLHAESGFGEGEITHHLLKSHQRHKETLAIAIPHLIKTPRLLKKLLLDNNGLAILMQVMERTCDLELPVSEDLQFTTSSLHVLTNSLNISVTKNSPHLTPPSAIRTRTNDNEELTIFTLDDGSQMPAARSLLCEKSPYFEAMFRGNFSEAQQKCISLPQVSRQCFQNILNLLEYDEIPSSLNHFQALDVLKLLDRFLIPSDPRVADIILNSLTSEVAVQVYAETLSSGQAPIFTFLKQTSLRCILTTDMDFRSRMKIFSELLTKFGKEFLGNVESLIKTEIDHSFHLVYKKRCKKQN